MRARRARAEYCPSRRGRLFLAFILLQVGALICVPWKLMAAPPCDDPVAPPPPPPPACGTPPCLPNTGGGGAGEYCDTHPQDPDCAKPGGIDFRTMLSGLWKHEQDRRSSRSGIVPFMVGFLPLLTARLSSPPVAGRRAPPCQPPSAPTPVPLEPLPDPAAVASRLGRDLEGSLPTITLAANPTLGLVNLESWFWVEGYDGRDFRASESFSSPPYESAMTVAARCTPRLYRWDFGDGRTIEIADKTGLGVNAAGGRQPSSVGHTYKVARPNAGYPVYLTVDWLIEYHINDGPPQSLTVVTRQFVMLHRVQEVQPVIVR